MKVKNVGYKQGTERIAQYEELGHDVKVVKAITCYHVYRDGKYVWTMDFEGQPNGYTIRRK